MQLALDSTTTDLCLDAAGNIATIGDDSPDLVVQRVATRLRTFQGECYLDRSVGVPYFQEVLKRRPDLSRIRALFVERIRSVPGVASVTSADVSFDPASRQFSLTFSAVTTSGATISGSL